VSQKSEAARCLQDVETCPSALYACARILFGEDFDEYEPETIRTECLRRKLEVPEENLQTLLASLALREDGRFFLDANVFENTVLVFNDIEPSVHQLQRAEPEHIAWAVHEACELTKDMFGADDVPCDYLDYEVESYTAATCLHDGMVTVPPCLSFCGERLEALSSAEPEFISEVKKAWGELNMDKLSEHPFSESDVDIQLALMASVHLYFTEQVDRCKDQLSWY
jgi:hypothetical protein